MGAMESSIDQIRNMTRTVPDGGSGSSGGGGDDGLGRSGDRPAMSFDLPERGPPASSPLNLGTSGKESSKTPEETSRQPDPEGFFVPSPPDVKREEMNRQKADWENFNRSVWNLPNSTDAERRIYPQLFALEGGTKVDPDSVGGTSSGITPGILAEVRKRGLPELASLPSDAQPKDLTLDQRAAIYRDYFDITLRTIGGHKAFDYFEKDVPAAALADTIFRHGRGQGTRIIQEATNSVLAKQGMPLVAVDSQMGHGTLQPFVYLSTDDNLTRQLLGNLAEKRLKPFPKEGQRFDFFRSR